MEDVFRFADDLGPLKLVHIHRSSIGLTTVVAIDNTIAGHRAGTPGDADATMGCAAWANCTD